MRVHLYYEIENEGGGWVGGCLHFTFLPFGPSWPRPFFVFDTFILISLCCTFKQKSGVVTELNWLLYFHCIVCILCLKNESFLNWWLLRVKSIEGVFFGYTNKTTLLVHKVCTCSAICLAHCNTVFLFSFFSCKS